MEELEEMYPILISMVSKRLAVFLVSSLMIPFLASKGIALGIPTEQLTNVVGGYILTTIAYLGSQGLADWGSKGATSASANFPVVGRPTPPQPYTDGNSAGMTSTTAP